MGMTTKQTRPFDGILDLILNDSVALDAWVDAMPDDPYSDCPCGCGMKWKYARIETLNNVRDHVQMFVDKHNKGETA